MFNKLAGFQSAKRLHFGGSAHRDADVGCSGFGNRWNSFSSNQLVSHEKTFSIRHNPRRTDRSSAHLGCLAELAIPYMGNTNSKALCDADATELSMQNIKKAIMGGGSDAAFYLDSLDYFPKDQKERGQITV